MSIRIRLALLLAGIVVVTVFVVWFFTQRAVVGPFVEEVRRARIAEAVEAATRYDAGEELAAISRSLGRRIVRRRDLPRPVRHAHRRHGRCRSVEDLGYEVVVCHQPNTPVFVRSDFGWLAVHSAFDAEARRRGLGQALIVLALVIAAASAWMAVVVTRPIRTTVLAMNRMAAGDLGHRLPEVGSKELAEVARAFNRMADRIDRVLNAEREMMAGISHELRTPLARLRLEVELLADGGVPKMRRDAMESDVEEIDRLIGELLMLSRLRIGERTLEQDPLDLKAVVEKAIARTSMPKHKVVLEGKGARIRGDEVRLVRVVTNLLENARKYAPQGSTLRIDVEDRKVIVRDEGPGVPEDDLERLFEPFFRTDRARGSATGSGLGLMIARQVVELHGGTIQARNADGGGLVIEFVLPDPVSGPHPSPEPSANDRSAR